jgi:hypothetical protein
MLKIIRKFSILTETIEKLGNLVILKMNETHMQFGINFLSHRIFYNNNGNLVIQNQIRTFTQIPIFKWQQIYIKKLAKNTLQFIEIAVQIMVEGKKNIRNFITISLNLQPKLPSFLLL